MRNNSLLCLLIVILVAAGCSESGAPPDAPSPGPEVISTNNRAVGLMGQFRYGEALEQFEQLSGDWPGTEEFEVNQAIATLNRQQEGDEQRALDLAGSVLEANPGNLRAHYVSGLVHLYLGFPEKALPHFSAVAEGDPEDAHAAYYQALCHAQAGQYEAALAGYQQAMKLDPYLRSAHYGAFQSLQRLGRVDEAREVADTYQRLERNPRSHLAEFRYTRMGRWGEAVAIDQDTPGPRPVPAGPVFAGREPLPVSGHSDGAWMTNGNAAISVADIDHDGRHDLFLNGVSGPGADAGGNLVIISGVDETFTADEQHPLAAVTGVNAVLWGDFDNDGRTDAYLCRDGINQLWQQDSAGGWTDITEKADAGGGAFDTVDGAFFDADHDGDLDLFLVNDDGPNELLNNNLDGTFRPLAAERGIAGDGGPSRMVLPVDLDSDRDVDLVVLNSEGPHSVWLNDRLWSYRPAPGFDAFGQQPATAVLAADLDANGMNELYTLDPEGQAWRWSADPQGTWRGNALELPPEAGQLQASQLAMQDVNGDGRQDLLLSSRLGWAAVGLAENQPELLHVAWASQDASFDAVLAFTGASLQGPEMLALESGQLVSWAPGPGRHPYLALKLSGKQDQGHATRSNASGIGAQLTVRSGSQWSRLASFRSQTSPGQSLQPLVVGLNGSQRADFVSIDWSDGVFQSELAIEAGTLSLIAEEQRQLSSCPVLFAWNGEEYAFVSDFLGVGGIGYAVGPGEYSTPRPWENFLLPDGALQARQGRYALKIGEPMEEVAYIDAARLLTYDLPAGWNLVMDERMGVVGPEPTGEPRYYRREMLPVAAVNDRSENVLDALLKSDHVAAPVGPLDERFIGRLAGEHELILSFGQAIDSSDGHPMLVADGWIEYPYSQTSFAAWQAGAAFEAPTLDAWTGEQWQTVYPQFGFPAGMPRRMSLPLDALPANTRKLRLRSNLQIYWDRIAVAWAETPAEVSVSEMPLHEARFTQPGFAQRSTLAQFRPYYDYSKLSPYWDTRYMAGNYTRPGPVKALVESADDAVAIIGPGE
ncbi:MAG: VCBS repeat-containing protein, partial [Gammaproteobacteria bacterium]|nr:VCBS repeat-containing protein [Gammaproteobacteria bacterium]